MPSSSTNSDRAKILDASRTELMWLIDEGKANGADSVIFGCTEIGLIFDPVALPLPAFDSTVIHAEAVVRFALDEASTCTAGVSGIGTFNQRILP